MSTHTEPPLPEEGEFLFRRTAGRSRLAFVSRLSRQLDRIEAISKVFMALLVMALILVVSMQVANRYTLKIPLAWTQEVSLFSLIWMSFIGASVAVRHHAHFTVMLLQDLVPDAWSRWINMVVYLLMLVLALVLLVYGVDFARMGLGRLSSAMEVRMIWFYLAIPTAAALMTVYLLERIAIDAAPAGEEHPGT